MSPRIIERELTDRECAILQQLADGLTRRETAEVLGITEATVRTHCSRILVKTQTRNITHAVVEALRRGDIE